MITWNDLTEEQRRSAMNIATGWLASAIGAHRLREEAEKAEQWLGDTHVTMALLELARELES